MASTRAFLAHRLGHRNGDCEEGYCHGTLGTDVVASHDVGLPETRRRRYSNAKHSQNLRRGCDGVSLRRISPTIPPNNEFRAPPTPIFHSLSKAFSCSTLFLHNLPNATRVSAASCSPSWGAGRVLPASRKDFETDHPHDADTYSPEVARLPIFHPKLEHSLAGREDDELDCSPPQAVPRSLPQIQSLWSIPKNLALDQDLLVKAGRDSPNTPSEAANPSSGNPITEAVTRSARGVNTNSSSQSQKISLFSFSSQHSQSFAASLLRLEKTLQKYEEAIFEILNAQASRALSQATSPKDQRGLVFPAIQTTFDAGKSTLNKMSPRFRSLSGKLTPKKSKETSPRAVFPDFPEAYSAVAGPSAAMVEKIPSPTPGMPAMDDPYARLPPTIDLPETPAKHIGGPADEEIKARVASSVFPKIPERPVTPLLPPTPERTQAERQGSSSPVVAQLFREPSPEEDRTGGAFGEEGYELDDLSRAPHPDRTASSSHDPDTESPDTISSFGLESPPKSSAYRAPERQGPRRGRFVTDVHQSSTLSSIIGKYNGEPDLIQYHEGSERSIEICDSQEVSSLSAVDDGEAHPRDSTAGHTPPLAGISFGRKAPQHSPAGQPPRGPLPPLPARSPLRAAPDVFGSEPTIYGNTQDLLNMRSDADERELHPTLYLARPRRPRAPVFSPVGRSTSPERQLIGQCPVPGRHAIFDIDHEMIGRVAEDDSKHSGVEHRSKKDERDVVSREELLQPVAYNPSSEDRRFPVVGRRPPQRPVIYYDDEDEGEPIRLRRRPHLLPEPDVSRLQQRLDDGGPQSSSSQGLSTTSSFGRRRPASGMFQHDDTLVSLVGEVPPRSHQDMLSLIEDAGALFSTEEGEGGAIFNQDVVAVQNADEGEDGDWETVLESGLRTRVPQSSIANREETATSLANMSSYASLTGSVPATPWDPLTGRQRMLTHPPRAALPYRSRLRTDEEMTQPIMPQEYESSREALGYGERGMTRGMRPQAIGGLRPAFAPTDEQFATIPERFQSTYRHPEPILKEHKHPFSERPPNMGPTEESGADPRTNPNIANAEAGYFGHTQNYADEVVYTSATETGLVMSQKRNTQQFEARGGEIDTQDTTEFYSRPSNLSIDGSYPESFNSAPALSTSSITHDSHYLPQSTGTFSKTTTLGPKANITGSFDGTGMRAVGSSEADYSTDSAMMRSHKYERLDDERTPVQAGPSTARALTMQPVPKPTKKVTFAEGTQTQKASQSSTAVLTKHGLSISGPKEFKIPTTLPNRNSFAISKLNTAKALDQAHELTDTPYLYDYDAAKPEHMKLIQELIEMGADDWKRLQSTCPTFPLRKDHLDDFMELDGVSTGIKRYMRDGIQPDGRFSETAKCDHCSRWERSHAAVLRRQPFNAVRRPTQKEIGRKAVLWSVAVPFVGWALLFAIANKLEASNDLMAAFTKGVIREFGDEEVEMANFYLKFVVAGLLVLFVGLLVFTIIVVASS